MRENRGYGSEVGEGVSPSVPLSGETCPTGMESGAKPVGPW